LNTDINKIVNEKNYTETAYKKLEEVNNNSILIDGKKTGFPYGDDRIVKYILLLLKIHSDDNEKKNIFIDVDEKFTHELFINEDFKKYSEKLNIYICEKATIKNFSNNVVDIIKDIFNQIDEFKEKENINYHICIPKSEKNSEKMKEVIFYFNECVKIFGNNYIITFEKNH
jgi:hypothetical protein